MCLSKPSMPAMPAPEKPQDAKMPEQSPYGAASEARRRMAQTGSAATSTLLTGPSGVENSSLMLGRSTLLGQ